jgi:ATP-binding cassette, subfamily F, member 2
MGPKREKKAPKSTKAAASAPVVSTENMTPAEIAAEKLRDMGIVATCALNSKKQHANVRDIAVSNITVTFHGTPLLEETELNLNYGNRYGFIGRNGCGKSTFLNVSLVFAHLRCKISLFVRHQISMK